MGTGSLQRGPRQRYELDWMVGDDTRTMLTIRSYSIKFGFIVLWTTVRGRLEMIRTVRIGAMLALEWQEVYEMAGRV